jgi:putative pyruvate formate lyase activating enzyme
MGRAVSADEFAGICLALEDAGALNVNIVTGSHAIPALAAGLEAAKTAGLTLPVCWNSSAYESIAALKVIAPFVDIWLPDLKTLDKRLSASLFNAPDYPETATEAVRFMLGAAPLRFSGDGQRLLSGVIVRHLFLPGLVEETVAALGWLKKHADSRALISLMTQYTPVSGGLRRGQDARVFEDRLVSADEAKSLRGLVEAYRFREAFFQEPASDCGQLPDFSSPRSFPPALAQPVWHWTCGFVRARAAKA